MPRKKRVENSKKGLNFLSQKNGWGGGQTKGSKKRVLGIDPSTRAIAACLLIEGQPQTLLKMDLFKSDLYDRLHRAKKWFPMILEIYKPDLCVIEQPIFLKNPMTTKNLSYVVGILLGEILINDIEVVDISPSTWKRFLGYKFLTRQHQAEIIAALGKTAGRKEIERLRKSQIQDILKDRYPMFDWSDNDIADACGIALWAWSNHGEAI